MREENDQMFSVRILETVENEDGSYVHRVVDILNLRGVPSPGDVVVTSDGGHYRVQTCVWHGESDRVDIVAAQILDRLDLP